MTRAHFRRTRLVSDAVVSSYINDIATRTDSGAAAAEAPARRPSGSAHPRTRGSLRRRRAGHAAPALEVVGR